MCPTAGVIESGGGGSDVGRLDKLGRLPVSMDTPNSHSIFKERFCLSLKGKTLQTLSIHFTDKIKTCAYSLILTIFFYIGKKILLIRHYFMLFCMKLPKELHTNKKKLYKVIK